VIESLPRAQVRAQVDGVLDRWWVQEGDTVVEGNPIAVLWNPELESAVLELRARAERLQLIRAQAELEGDRSAAASAASLLEDVEREFAVLDSRRQRLVVRSPIAGVVLTHRPQERLGQALEEGTLLVEVASLDGRRARVRVRPKQAGEVAAGQRASLKLYSRPDVKFVSTVSVVAPAAEDGWLEAEVAVPNGSWQPAPGMTGIAKIETRRGTVAQAIGRAVRQTIRIDLWL
jgi:multidrug efflux pump subunit AcrA (membrane-fusion protein)